METGLQETASEVGEPFKHLLTAWDKDMLRQKYLWPPRPLLLPSSPKAGAGL